MSTAPETPDHPRTQRQRALWPGLVWSVPVAALMIVGYLGIQALTRRGELVTVTFERAADAQPNDTKVLYQGVEVGYLTEIVPNVDGRRIDFKLRLVSAANPGLNTNARFWLIGATPNLNDLSSLKAVVSGVAIGYAPGTGGTPTTRFDGLDKAPIVLPGDRGTHYVLNARKLGSIREGSEMLFHGQPIGKVTGVKFNGAAGFRVTVFIFDPYDSLIKSGARFWRMSTFRLSLANGGFNATLAPANTLLAGGIDMEVATSDSAAPRSPAETEFTLYANENAARQGLSGPTARYRLAFAGGAGKLDEDAAITLLGFQIGEVESAALAYDPQTGRPFTTVTAVLYPHQLGLSVPTGSPDGNWQAITDAKLRRLLKFGYRARLQQTPALVGDLTIALVEVKNAAPADLVDDGSSLRIPSAPGGSDIEDITLQADQILAKVNAIPVEKIGQNLQDITARLNHLIGSPEIADSLTHVNKTLAQVDQMLSQVQPQIGPLMMKLNQAAGEVAQTAQSANQLLGSGSGGDMNGAGLPETIHELTEAARSIRNLADYLDRHPDALIRGKRPER